MDGAIIFCLPEMSCENCFFRPNFDQKIDLVLEKIIRGVINEQHHRDLVKEIMGKNKKI